MFAGLGAVADQAIVAQDLRVLVGLAIAVVVDAIAHFCGGEGAAARGPEAVDAFFDACLTGADVRGALARRAVLAFPTAFIDLAVAVVVDVVIAALGGERADRRVCIVAVLGQVLITTETYREAISVVVLTGLRERDIHLIAEVLVILILSRAARFIIAPPTTGETDQEHQAPHKRVHVYRYRTELS